MGKQQDVAEAIALMDKSAERTTPNAQTQAWATIRAHIEGLEAQLRTRGDYVNEKLIERAEVAEARVWELDLEADAARWLPKAAPWKPCARLEVTVREYGNPEITCTGWLFDGKGMTPTHTDFLAAVCRWILANVNDDRPAFNDAAAIDAAIATTEQADED